MCGNNTRSWYHIPVTGDREAADRRDSAGEEMLSEAFWSVARQLRETSQATLAPWDITPSSLRALRVLGRHGMMRLSELSDHLRIARPPGRCGWPTAARSSTPSC